MDPGNNTLNAAEVINTYNEHDLARILRVYGEEKFASQIAREIVRRREQEPIETTGQFVEIIKAGIPAAARRHGGHPAKKSFQAIRIEVNHELDVLERGLDAATRWLNPGGRICVISYHSLEDRIVKNHFKEMSQGARVRRRFRCACAATCRYSRSSPANPWLPSLMRLSATLGRDQPKSAWRSVCRRDRAILDLPLAP